MKINPMKIAPGICLLLACCGLPAAFAHDSMTLPVANKVRVDAALQAVANDALPTDYAVPGFMPGGEIGPAENGLSLAEASVLLQWHDADRALSGELEAGMHGGGHNDSVEIEQAWIASGHGPLTVLAGRQFAPLGLRNTQHGTDAAFPESSLAYRVFLGDHYRDDGLALRVQAGESWLFGAGIWQGAFPAGGIDASGFDALTAHADRQFAFSGGSRLLTRFSLLAARAALRYDERVDSGHSHDPFVTAPEPVYFSGDSTLAIASLQWLDGGGRHELLLELFGRIEDGEVRDLNQLADYQGSQSGLQAEWLWAVADGWRLGLREVLLGADNEVAGPGAGTVAAQAGLLTDGDPRETSLVVERRLDDRQTLRLQVVDSTDITAGDLVLLQYAFRWEHALSAGGHP